jgi:nucleoside-diphosphate-sugar epimerase
MRIAILGATSEIAKDLILAFDKDKQHSLVLFARRPDDVRNWMHVATENSEFECFHFDLFSQQGRYDIIINFIGVGNPAKTAILGASIFDITLKYDDLVLHYIEANPTCKYIFLSSGAAYCSTFEEPANENTKSNIDINHLRPQDWYGVAKLHAECRHRALPHLSIVDIRIFNYFSHTQNIAARFLITDILRAIKNKTLLEISSDFMMRDYLHPSDFYQIIKLIITSNACNSVFDCYSKKPIDKNHLIMIMGEEFSLSHKIIDTQIIIKATGNKPHYYSTNKKAFKDLDYKPTYTSEESLLEQMKLSLFINKGKRNA